MRRAERLAWLAVAGLGVIALLLIGGGFAYRVTSFWAGAMLVCGQAVVVGLGAWGLGLARQAAELREVPPASTLRPESSSDSGMGSTGFRMSADVDEEHERQRAISRTGDAMAIGHAVGRVLGGGLGGAAGRAIGLALGARKSPAESLEAQEEIKTLDSGFQRILVGTTGLVMVGLAGLMMWVIYTIYAWSASHPDVPVPVVGSLADALMKAGRGMPQLEMDEMCVLLGLASAGIYGVLFWITRPTRETAGYGEATHSSFTLGIAGMTAVGVGTLLAYFKVAWAGEWAAGIVTALLALQGLELLVNSFRSYSAIEELEEEAVDLQATPLTPMLVSVWLGGLKLLFAQSIGLHEEKKGERGIVARMMPRTLLALVVLALGASCLRVVRPGHVGILERLGYTPLMADGRRPEARAILQPGLHLLFPWPIDELVDIPTEQLQTVDVGTELHRTGAWKNVDFQFWTIGRDANANEADDLFITGDPGSPQFLETYVEVQWRVADPARFYAAISHSEFLEKSAAAARTLPIYQAMVQQCTSYAVTQTFAIHSMEQILITDRREAEDHCRRILQEKLDSLCALPGDKPGAATRGIDVMYVTIKDLHPPYWHEDRPATNAPRIGGKLEKDEKGLYVVVDNPQQSVKKERGPASAFELVVTMREFKEQIINSAQQEAIQAKNLAHGDAKSALADANAYAAKKVAAARGDADRLKAMLKNPKSGEPLTADEIALLKRKLFFDTFKDLFDPVNKVVVDPQVKDVHIYQNTEKGGGGVTGRPPG